MPQANAAGREFGVDPASAANDDDRPPAKWVTLSKLASLAEVDEDTLLRRLAAVLGKRKNVEALAR